MKKGNIFWGVVLVTIGVLFALRNFDIFFFSWHGIWRLWPLIFVFWGMMIILSIKIFRSKNRLCSAIGGFSLSLIMTQLITGIGSQHFYPLEETFGLWMAMFLAVRVYVEEKRTKDAECYQIDPVVLPENQVATTPVYA